MIMKDKLPASTLFTKEVKQKPVAEDNSKDDKIKSPDYASPD
jgi:hypothetical protein